MADVELVFPFELGTERPWVLPPLGLGYLAAVLERRGISWGITDCTFTGIDNGIQNIIEKRPRMVGVYSMVTLRKNALRVARGLRGKVDHLVAGGPLPSIYPDQFLPEFDLCVTGEAEFAFAEVAARTLRGEGHADVPGVVRVEDGELKASGEPLYVQDLDSVPHPERQGFPNDGYRSYWKREFGYAPASIIATRGCPYCCDFCSRPVSGDRFRKRSPDDIIEEVKEITAIGYDYLWFADDAFTFDSDLVIGVSEGIRRLGKGLRWDCLSRTDSIDEDLVRTMKASGLSRVYLGIESGSNETLRLMSKRATVEDADNAISSFSRHGVKAGGFFMIGYPGESAESIWSTLNFSAREDLDYISYTVPYPLPGSPLYDRVRVHTDPALEWSRERENTLLYDSEFPQGVLRQLIELAYQAHAIAKKEGRPRALELLSSREAEFRRKLGK